MNTLLNEASSQDQLLKTLEDLTFSEISGNLKEQLQLGEKSDNLSYIGNCTDDEVVDHIFGDASGFANAVEEYGDDFVLDDLVVKYDPKKDIHSFYYKEQFVTEKLSASQPASAWIRDFIDSTNPKFKGKTKKERISMALGAYYAAQKNEACDDSSPFKANDDSIEYDPEQLAAGIKIELEHTDDEEIATIIAKHHLAEDPEYYIKLVSCVEKGIKEAKIPSYKYDVVIAKLKDGIWDSSYDVKRGKHLEVTDNNTKKTMTIFVEEYGAGFEGTDKLRKKYIKDTPGQRIVKHMDKTNTESEEAKTFVSKGIYTLDGKKNDGARSSKLFLQALDADGFLHDLSWKEWSESDLEDTSSDSAKKQFIDRLTKQIKMFNKRIDLNTWLKGGNRSFIDTVNYIFKLDPNIKYSKAAGLKEDAVQEAIDINNYMATSEKSQFGGYRPKVVNKSGKVLYLGQASYNTPFEAKDHAEDYLKQYAKGISEPRVPIKGTYGLKEEKEHYDSWIIKPRDGGQQVKVKAPDETSAIEIALGRKPSQNEIDFFNFHYILIQEKTNVATLRHMKIVELATKCTDSNLVEAFVEQQYKPQTSALEIKESFRSFVANKKS